MARDDPHFRLRLPADLKARIEESALEANRSINAEIVHRLSSSLSPVDPARLGTIAREFLEERQWWKSLLARSIAGALSADVIEALQPLLSDVAPEPPRRRDELQREYDAIAVKLRMLLDEPRMKNPSNDDSDDLLTMLARLTTKGRELLRAQKPE